ncbi:Myosin head (motor domain) family protein [Acanthocheilonema viteae]
MSFDSTSSLASVSTVKVHPHRSLTVVSNTNLTDDSHFQTVSVYLYSFNPVSYEDRISFDFHKWATTEELIEKVLQQKEELAHQCADDYELYEIMGTLDGQTFKERRLDRGEYPVAVQMLWTRPMHGENNEAAPKNRLVLRHKDSSLLSDGVHFGSTKTSSTIDSFLAKFLTQLQDREYPDLCMLPELTEQTLLDNLKDRFASGHIYTYIGPILLAVNPFNFFPIYNPKYARLYSQIRHLSSMPPHIFAIANITYHSMLRIKENQCIVISGESGSGKTESTNFLLHHFTTLSQKGSSTGSSVEKTLLSAGPVLEAFGNAVTVQNNNSSRFGKFIRVNYRENGMVSGANVEIYLLEKSRIISQAIGERNYHVFYYLLNGASDEERQRHYLMQPTDYSYLNQNNFYAAEGVNEPYEYQRLKYAMDAVGFSQQSQQNMFAVISAVLLLGNIQYVRRSGYHSDENVSIGNEEVLSIISTLLHIKASNLQQALTMRRTVMKNDVVISQYNVSEARDTRDAMAKCLYNALFHWIVLRINQALLKKERLTSKMGYYIGILDIFGFEDVGGKWNSFEQLCINYANEHLQAYFNQHIFQFEQEEYLKEGITWTNIEYTDNTECVHLFQSKPYGILRLIDEESNINNGTDESMLDKLNHFLKNNEYYETPQKRESAFIVAHYAGKVKYQIKGFREKNKDLMRQEVLMAVKKSKSAFVRGLVGNDPVAVFRWDILRATFRAVNAFWQAGKLAKKRKNTEHLELSSDSKRTLTGVASDTHLNAFLRGEINQEVVPSFCDTSFFTTIVSHARKQPNVQVEDCHSALKSLQAVKAFSEKKSITGKPSSVGKQFQNSLSRLMKTLSQATPYFIRCIKSNNEKIPNHFDDNIILRQLRYTGMLETVRIRRAGYSVRIEYEDFIKQYRILLPKGCESRTEDVKEFFTQHALIDSNEVQFGITKVFMRDAEKLILDDHLHRVIIKHIETLQRCIHTLMTRRKYIKLRNTVIAIQAATRGMIVRNRLHEMYDAASMIQRNWKRFKIQRNYQQIRRAVVAIQAHYRGAYARKRYEEMRRESDPKKHPPNFTITKVVKKMGLASFNLNDPESLAQFAGSDEDEEELSVASTNVSILDEEEDGQEDAESNRSSIQFDSVQSETELDATFILEDKKLKLVETPRDSSIFKRRISSASTGTTKKMKMFRRAASTETDRISIPEHMLPSSPESKSKSRKMGFMRAKKHLKAFLSRRSDSFVSNGECRDFIAASTTQIEATKAPASVVAKHNLKLSRLHRNEICTLCNKNFTGILIKGNKCTDCKLSFHKECSSFASNIPCQVITQSLRPHNMLPKKEWEIKSSWPHKQSFAPLLLHPTKSFNLHKTKQQTDPSDMIIESDSDLRQFNVFIFKKLMKLGDNKKKRDTKIDAIFKKAFKEFHMEIIGYQAVVTENKTMLKYHDLITIFEGSLTKVSAQEQVTFPTTLGVNAFRGFLNEFLHEQIKMKKSSKKSNVLENVRKKRRKSDATVLHNGHRFKLEYVHVPTYCEVCNLFMWHAEKIFICKACRISCHKKCHTKIATSCAQSLHQANLQSGGRFFGANLSSLVNDQETVPIVIDKLFMAIELKALFVEGIYRKSAALAQVRNARREIENAEFETLSFDDVSTHIMTTLVKSFFRELPEPLITYDLYENFLNASEVEESAERIRCLSVIVELLPKCNRSVLDRLLYHLARVANQESVNKMSAANLALIFAPCILRTNQTLRAQDQLRDVERQAICVQALIEEKLRQFRLMLTEIVSLETASEKIVENLRLIDEHKGSVEEEIQTSSEHFATARQLFVEQLEFLDGEKEKLIQELPPMAPVASVEDLSSLEECSNSALLIEEEPQEEYALDLNAPPIFNTLKNATKSRSRGSPRRPPSRQHRRSMFEKHFPVKFS